MDVRKLSLRSAGMFSNVNEVIQQLYLAETNGYQFVIDWSKSCYRDEQLIEDPWLYYFKPCFPGINIDDQNIETLPKLVGGKPVACSKDNIITPRLYNGVCSPLLLPKNRDIGNRLIDKYIAANKVVTQEVNRFKDENFHGNIIGLHIRGAGKTDGGVSQLANKDLSRNGVPFDAYFKSVNRIIKDNQDLKIFTCSDSSLVIDEVTREYGERVITYDATRSEFGEMHANHERNKGLSFLKYKLGLDVVVEAYLLSEVNFLVHGTSNIVNFVLCKNPDLKHDFIYEDDYDFGGFRKLKLDLFRVLKKGFRVLKNG